MERMAAQGNSRKRENDIDRVANRNNRARSYRERWPLAREARRSARERPASAPAALMDRPNPADSPWSVQE